MKATGVVRAFDDLGRIIIPKEIRKQVLPDTYDKNTKMEIYVDGHDNTIVLKPYVLNSGQGDGS